MSNNIKRYSLVLPVDLYNELKAVAEKRSTTVVDVIRKFIKLGLLADRLEDEPEAALIIREGKSEKQIMII